MDLKCDGNNNCGDYSDEFGCPRTDPVCKTKITKDKPESKECVLPFRYNGKLYNGCPPDPDVDGEYWCSTKVKRDGTHVLGNYGLCNSECPKEEAEKEEYEEYEVEEGTSAWSTAGRTDALLSAKAICNNDLITAVKKGYVDNCRFKLETCADPDAADEG